MTIETPPAMPYWAAAVTAMRLFVATLESELRPDADIQSPRFLADILQNAKTPTSGNQRGHCGNAKWRERLTLEWMVSQPPPQYISNPSPPFSVSGECVRLYNSCISTPDKKNETMCLVNLLIIIIKMVPPGRLELPRPCGQQILSLPRLPIPPQGHRVFVLYINKLLIGPQNKIYFRFAPV